MTHFFYYISEVMIEGLKLLKQRINTHLREDIIQKIVKDRNLDLTPRQDEIIRILSDKNNTFIITSKELSDKLHVAARTIQKDLKLLLDFDLIERVKAPNNRTKNYFRLKVNL